MIFISYLIGIFFQLKKAIYTFITFYYEPKRSSSYQRKTQQQSSSTWASLMRLPLFADNKR